MSMREAGSHICGRLLHFKKRIAAHLKERVRSRAVLARELEGDRKSHDALVERLRLCIIADRNPDEAQPEAAALPRLALSRARLRVVEQIFVSRGERVAEADHRKPLPSLTNQICISRPRVPLARTFL